MLCTVCIVKAWVAQRIEQFPPKEKVAGSIPAPGTKLPYTLSHGGCGALRDVALGTQCLAKHVVVFCGVRFPGLPKGSCRFASMLRLVWVRQGCCKPRGHCS